MPTVSLRRFVESPLALEVRPVARLEGGRVVARSASFFPLEGACRLVLWTPGPREPAFALVEGSLLREGSVWRFDGDAPAEGWVVLWAPA